MGKIETLQNHILEKVQATGEAQVQELQSQLDEELVEFKDQIAKKLQQGKDSYIKQQEDRIAIRKQSLANEMRNAQLSHKQGLLEQIIEAVPAVMSDHLQGDLVGLIKHVFEKAQLEAAELTLGQKTAEKFDQSMKDHLQATCPQVRLVEETIPQKSGFVLKQAGVNLNYLFEDVVNELKPQLLIELENTLKS